MVYRAMKDVFQTHQMEALDLTLFLCTWYLGLPHDKLEVGTYVTFVWLFAKWDACSTVPWHSKIIAGYKEDMTCLRKWRVEIHKM